VGGINGTGHELLKEVGNWIGSGRQGNKKDKFLNSVFQLKADG
jgi:hypothetical protein